MLNYEDFAKVEPKQPASKKTFQVPEDNPINSDNEETQPNLSQEEALRRLNWLTNAVTQLTNDKIELTSTLEETREQLEAQRVELARQASMEQPDQPDQPAQPAQPAQMTPGKESGEVLKPTKPPQQRSAETVAIYNDYERFEEELRKAFGVKELFKDKRPEKLVNYIAMVIKIDDQQYA
ncbi:hypothetical protein DL764_007369 [Monosporascus ibericus]|uniref:Uncharacterized protein n=1 Tax=Monosporascus ibericus TaxID=155417 RepID=A0A4Q4T1U0_9PEZI|nr:hypothetical protein DL764_007369 [Monosporascus ibericus]